MKYVLLFLLLILSGCFYDPPKQPKFKDGNKELRAGECAAVRTDDFFSYVCGVEKLVRVVDKHNYDDTIIYDTITYYKLVRKGCPYESKVYTSVDTYRLIECPEDF